LVLKKERVIDGHAAHVVDSDRICLQVAHILLEPCFSDFNRLSLINEDVTIEANILIKVAIDDRYVSDVAQVQEVKGLSHAIQLSRLIY